MNLLRNSWKNRWLIVMSLPALILFIMFSYIPMFGLVLAFKKFDYSKGIFGSPWCGLNNFRLLFISGQTFWRLTRNTVGYYLLFTITGTIGNVFLAIGIYEFAYKKLGKFFQSCMILPTFITYIRGNIYCVCLSPNGWGSGQPSVGKEHKLVFKRGCLACHSVDRADMEERRLRFGSLSVCFGRDRYTTLRGSGAGRSQRPDRKCGISPSPCCCPWWPS